MPGTEGDGVFLAPNSALITYEAFWGGAVRRPSAWRYRLSLVKGGDAEVLLLWLSRCQRRRSKTVTAGVPMSLEMLPAVVVLLSEASSGKTLTLNVSPSQPQHILLVATVAKFTAPQFTSLHLTSVIFTADMTIFFLCLPWNTGHPFFFTTYAVLLCSLPVSRRPSSHLSPGPSILKQTSLETILIDFKGK